MILSFRDRETESVWRGDISRRLPREIQQVAPEASDAWQRQSAAGLARPARQSARAKRKGQWSIRINDQWRICFEWDNGGASNVEIVDYH